MSHQDVHRPSAGQLMSANDNESIATSSAPHDNHGHKGKSPTSAKEEVVPCSQNGLPQLSTTSVISATRDDAGQGLTVSLIKSRADPIPFKQQTNYQAFAIPSAD